MENSNDAANKENSTDSLAASQLQVKAAARKTDASTGNTMQKLAATFDTLQEQLQHLSRREHSFVLRDKNAAAAAHPTTAAAQPPPLACSDKPSMPLPATAPVAPGVHAGACMFNAAATAAASQGTTAMLLQPYVAPTECVLGNGGNGTKGGSDSLFEYSSGSKDSQVHKFAEQLFNDQELLDLCDDGLNKQLQRTKDGATDQSRIQELAALVKLLRKCVRELASRCSLYVDQCLKVEKDYLKQVEGIQLQSECVVKSLEAELAGAKKDLAQYEATFKMDKAKWGADLEDQKYEMMRLRRELERMTEERDRAREGGKRAEQARQQLEVELKELKKQSTQQIREVASTQSEVVQKLTEAAERRDNALKAAQEERHRLSNRLDAAQSCIDALQGELSMLQAVHDKAQDTLRSKLAEEQTRQQLMTKVQAELDLTREQLAETSSVRQELHQQLQEARCAQQSAEDAVHTGTARLQELELELASVTATLEGERSAWEEERQTLQEAHRQANQRETALLDEKNLLKTAVAAAIGQKEGLEVQLATLQKQHTLLTNERNNLRNQVEFATGNQQAAEEQAAELQRSLELLQKQMQALQEELQVKDARLQELEGEFAALKEVLGEFGQRDVVNNLLHKISTLQSAVAASNSIRRKLHNELVEVKGNIRVYCRVRPHAGSSCVRCMPDQCGLQISVEGKDHSLEFDKVYGPLSSQEEVFAGVSELVQSALDGYHVCLFSYGQTGAGKTYTMQGSDSPMGQGIIPRAVEKILQTAAQLEEQEWEYAMEASFIEIYNNQLRDLMGGTTAPYISDQNAIKHDAGGGHTTVAGVSKVPVKDAATAAELVQKAAAARSCEATAMNSSSSRSHAIFMLYITGSHPPSGTQLQGCLCLVDLAGCERLDRSQAQGQRKAEACAINQSLSSIGDVFAALASKSSHVPYRNSKLTYLLQPCLGGHGKTLMFVNINPEPASAYESLCSLKFAANVNGCETAARGGARRNFVGGSAASIAAASVQEDDKRLSLPGFPRMAGSIPEPAAKRMSLAMPARVTGMPPAGAPGGKKRSAAPPAPSSGAGVASLQMLGNPAKRLKPST